MILYFQELYFIWSVRSFYWLKMFNHYLFKVNYLNWATRRRSKDKINLFSPRKHTFILAFFKIFTFSYLFKVQKYEWNIREKQIDSKQLSQGVPCGDKSLGHVSNELLIRLFSQAFLNQITGCLVKTGGARLYTSLPIISSSSTKKIRNQGCIW